jgi:hypothetical protein
VAARRPAGWSGGASEQPTRAYLADTAPVVLAMAHEPARPARYRAT